VSNQQHSLFYFSFPTHFVICHHLPIAPVPEMESDSIYELKKGFPRDAGMIGDFVTWWDIPIHAGENHSV